MIRVSMNADNTNNPKAEWAREKQITAQFGLTHMILYNLRREGRIRTLSLRDEGKLYGARLFNVASVREHLAKQEAMEASFKVPELPVEPLSRTSEDMIRLAFHAIDPDVFQPPSWLLDVEVIPNNDADHATLLIEKYAESVVALGSDWEKHGYLQGVLDANYLRVADKAASEDA